MQKSVGHELDKILLETAALDGKGRKRSSKLLNRPLPLPFDCSAPEIRAYAQKENNGQGLNQWTDSLIESQTFKNYAQRFLEVEW